MPPAAPPNAFAPMKTWLPPMALSACVQAVFWRSIVDMNLTDAQRWGHFPISPLVGLGCFLSGNAQLLAAGGAMHADTPRIPMTKLSLSGPQTTPRTVIYRPNTSGMLVVFYPDAWLALTGMSPNGLSDRFVDPRDLLQADLLAACERLCNAGDEDALVKQFFADLLPVWQQRTRDEMQFAGLSKHPSRFIGPWMDSLALRAAGTGWGRSLRQSERRIKQWTGLSLRKIQVSARGETVFFAVLEAIIDDRLDWTQIALDHGFSDQSHFIRETRRITGFSPEALRHGVFNEEPFWPYRAIAQLAGQYPQG